MSAPVLSGVNASLQPRLSSLLTRCPRSRLGIRSSGLFGKPLLTTLAVIGSVAHGDASHAGITHSGTAFAMFSFGGAAQSLAHSPVASEPDTDFPGEGLEFATFGAGCFWGVELAFQRVPGVLKTEVGYTQGKTDKPTYEQVCSGRTGHVEAVRVTFDPKEVSYRVLLDTLWKRHDPTQKDRQGNDVGTQYRSGVYFYSAEQEAAAKESMTAEAARLGRPLATELLPAKRWYPAELYHQQYLAKGGRLGLAQSAAKGCTDPIRCYG